ETRTAALQFNTVMQRTYSSAIQAILDAIDSHYGGGWSARSPLGHATPWRRRDEVPALSIRWPGRAVDVCIHRLRQGIFAGENSLRAGSWLSVERRSLARKFLRLRRAYGIEQTYQNDSTEQPSPK